jgi:hypothetical protein
VGINTSVETIRKERLELVKCVRTESRSGSSNVSETDESAAMFDGTFEQNNSYVRDDAGNDCGDDNVFTYFFVHTRPSVNGSYSMNE